MASRPAGPIRDTVTVGAISSGIQARSGAHGVRVQVVGSLAGAELHVVEGADLRLAETWCAPAPRETAVAVRDGTVVGALAVDAPRPFGRWRRRIGSALDPFGALQGSNSS
jgi:hypothetical protein